MVVVGRFAIENSPSRCAYCGQPFKQHLYAWRSSSGKLYCSEFCANDEESKRCATMTSGCSASRKLYPLAIFQFVAAGAGRLGSTCAAPA